MKFYKLIFCILFISFLQAQDLEKISLQLQWKHQFQFAGYYIAKEKGYFKDLGLDVNIKEYEYGMNTTNEVINNQSEYAIGRASLIVDKSKGKDIVLLSSVFQSSPLVVLTTKINEIKEIKDFKDKKIMLADDRLRNTALRAMILSQGLSYTDIKKQKHSFKLDDLISKKADLMTAYISNEPFRLKEKGIKYKYFAPKDYGYDFYSDLLFTSKKEIINNPKRVKKFIEASTKGWSYAFSNLDETVDLIYEKYNTQNKSREALIHEALELRKLAKLDLIPLGYINKSKIQKIYDVYHILGMIKENLNIDEVIYDENYEKRFLLSSNELMYLEEKQELKMCIDPNWLPFEKLEDNEHIGMTAEYIRLFQEKLPIPIKLVKTKSWNETLSFAEKRKCDFVSVMSESEKRKKDFAFTDPLVKMPIVIASTVNKFFINSLSDFNNEKFAIIEGTAYYETLKKAYPNIEVVEVKDTFTGLKGVENGKYYGYVGALAVVGYNIQENFLGDLKIVGKLNESWGFPMAARNDEAQLVSILNKLINSLTIEQKQEILNKWISIKYEEEVDYKIIFIISLFFIFIILIILYKNKSIQRINKKLQDYIKLVDENVLTSTTDLRGNIVYVSKAFCEISGYSKDELIGKNHNIVRHEDMDNKVFTKMWNTIKNGKTWQGEIKNKRRDGGFYWIKTTISPIFDEYEHVVGYTAIRHDITDKKLVEELSITDALTNIYNRRHFNDIFPKYINGAKRKDEVVSFLIMDVDYFKQYNDTYGHQEGDEVLKNIAKVLKDVCHRSDDISFRLGGEEFGVLFKSISKQKALFFANKIKDKIQNLNIPHCKSLTNSCVTVSMGLYSKKANEIEDFNDVFKKADELLYKSKENGRNTITGI